ncbi:MAG: orotidine-5'-phosphate decarboxylase [Trueperaceae bacterium]|nr:orotidine-5'-phosphate decarboxylase [Trueperaceae bacterium]
MNAPAAPFAARLEESMRARGSRVCLGIDPRADTHPLMQEGAPEPEALADRIVAFYRAMLAGAHDAIACVKPQSAFFEALGLPGARALAAVCDEARSHGLPIVLDAKRGDIGSTAEAYADAYLGDGPLRADALTVSPYLGIDTLEPFAVRALRHGRGLFVLVTTSNAGASALQDLVTEDGRRVYEHVADAVAALEARLAPGGRGRYGPFGAVVGATRPGRLAELRRRLPRSLLLVPGYGAQGAGAEDVVAAFDEARFGAIVSSSRALVPSPAATDLDAVARAAGVLATAMRDTIEAALERRVRAG